MRLAAYCGADGGADYVVVVVVASVDFLVSLLGAKWSERCLQKTVSSGISTICTATAEISCATATLYDVLACLHSTGS